MTDAGSLVTFTLGSNDCKARDRGDDDKGCPSPSAVAVDDDSILLLLGCILWSVVLFFVSAGVVLVVYDFERVKVVSSLSTIHSSRTFSEEN